MPVSLFATICLFLVGLAGAELALWAEQGEYVRQEQEIINEAAAEIENAMASRSVHPTSIGGPRLPIGFPILVCGLLSSCLLQVYSRAS